MAVETGAIPAQPVRLLAHVCSARALLIARADDVATARREIGGDARPLLAALTARPGS